jgi:hypothetical protein
MIELNCDTTRGEEREFLAAELAVAVAPSTLVVHDPPPADLRSENKYANDIKASRPEIATKIIEGKMGRTLRPEVPLNMPHPKEDEFKGNYGTSQVEGGEAQGEHRSPALRADEVGK